MIKIKTDVTTYRDENKKNQSWCFFDINYDNIIIYIYKNIL